MSTLLNTIARSAAWSAAGQWSTQIIQFAVSIVIARILLPTDYGLVSMASVFISLVSVFGNIGLGQALIQRKSITIDYISTAFWATFVVSIVIYAVAYLLAPFVGMFYDEPEVSSIVRVSAIGFIFGSVTSIQESLLSRKMAFRDLSIATFASSLLSSLVALLFAVSGMGVWSLVVGGLFMQVVRIPMQYFFTRWRPTLYFSWVLFKDLFSFGGNILGFGILNYIIRNLDNILIGRYLGANALGYYDLAYQVMLRPIQQVSYVITKPLFPALSSIQDDKVLAADTYKKVVRYISLISFPMMFGLCAVAPEFVNGVLGAKWSPAIPLLQVLTIVGAMQSIGTTVGSIYQSQNRTDIMLKWGLVATPVVALGFIIGVKWGVLGVAISYAIVSFGLWIGSHLIANRLISLRMSDFFLSLLPAFRASLSMFFLVFISRNVLIQFQMPMIHRFISLVAVGVLSYVIVLALGKNEELLKMKQMIVTKYSVEAGK